MNKKEQNNKGFSLVELIIVIAIMAILVGVLAPQFMKYIESSRQSTDMDTLASYKNAVEAAVIDSASKDTGAITSAVLTVDSAGTVSPNIDLSDVGLAAAGGTSPLKSKGWNGSTYTYAVSSGVYKWTANPATGDVNSNAPGKNLLDVFK